ncbi:MAG: UDP-N-acetylmuramoyl-L-alanine--D-glutamate ligase [Bacteroidota bacterium]
MAKRLVILGAGESGVGAAILGSKMGYDVLVSDHGAIAAETKALFHEIGVAFEEQGHSDQVYSANIAVKSPGIPERVPVVQRLVQEGIEVISEIEFGFRHLGGGQKVVAITGTNGKTTTTLLTHHLMSNAGLNVALGGNIGTSFARLVAEGGYDYYVVEVSSFQLDGIVHFKPDVAILLNITPDHLDRYNYEFKNYVRSKFRIIENLTKEECFIYCSDDRTISEELARYHVESCLFAISASKSDRAAAYMDNGHLIFNYQFKERDQFHKVPVTEIALIGKHNMINTMAAVLTSLHLDVRIEKLYKGLKTFKNIAHRLELVRVLDGIRYINDSKATNVDAVFYALEGIEQPIIWIAGGVDKGNDYTQIRELVGSKVRQLIGIGTDNAPLRMAFEGIVPITDASSIEEAVDIARSAAAAGDVVLLSPACASFDRFRNYEDRGDQFKAAVSELTNDEKLSV